VRTDFDTFDAISAGEHELVVFTTDPGTGLRAVIAIHSRERGPALGGCRMLPYVSETDALADAYGCRVQCHISRHQ